MSYFRPFKHTGEQLRELADELWERGFREISAHVHDLARIQESHENMRDVVNKRNEQK